MNMQLNIQTGYTTLMFDLLLDNDNTVLVCGNMAQAAMLESQFPTLEGRFVSLMDTNKLPSNVVILYDNYALEIIKRKVEHLEVEVKEGRAQLDKIAGILK